MKASILLTSALVAAILCYGMWLIGETWTTWLIVAGWAVYGAFDLLRHQVPRLQKTYLKRMEGMFLVPFIGEGVMLGMAVYMAFALFTGWWIIMVGMVLTMVRQWWVKREIAQAAH